MKCIINFLFLLTLIINPVVSFSMDCCLTINLKQEVSSMNMEPDCHNTEGDESKDHDSTCIMDCCHSSVLFLQTNKIVFNIKELGFNFNFPNIETTIQYHSNLYRPPIS